MREYNKDYGYLRYPELYHYEQVIVSLGIVLIDESNILIKLICKLLRNYFIHRWEVYFDEEEKKSNKKKKSTYKGRIKKKKV